MSQSLFSGSKIRFLAESDFHGASGTDERDTSLLDQEFSQLGFRKVGDYKLTCPVSIGNTKKLVNHFFPGACRLYYSPGMFALTGAPESGGMRGFVVEFWSRTESGTFVVTTTDPADWEGIGERRSFPYLRNDQLLDKHRQHLGEFGPALPWGPNPSNLGDALDRYLEMYFLVSERPKVPEPYRSVFDQLERLCDLCQEPEDFSEAKGLVREVQERVGPDNEDTTFRFLRAFACSIEARIALAEGALRLALQSASQRTWEFENTYEQAILRRVLEQEDWRLVVMEDSEDSNQWTREAILKRVPECLSTFQVNPDLKGFEFTLGRMEEGKEFVGRFLVSATESGFEVRSRGDLTIDMSREIGNAYRMMGDQPAQYPSNAFGRAGLMAKELGHGKLAIWLFKRCLDLKPDNRDAQTMIDELMGAGFQLEPEQASFISSWFEPAAMSERYRLEQPILYLEQYLANR